MPAPAYPTNALFSAAGFAPQVLFRPAALNAGRVGQATEYH